jgi:hypothetical protein
MTAVAVPIFFGLIGIVVGAVLGAVWWTIRFDDTAIDAGSAAGPIAVLRHDRRNTVVVSAVVALVVAGRLRGIGFIGILAGTFVLACYLRAWGRWIVLTCGWLPLTGRLPWAPAAFLEEARRRGVLRQAGACYQFRHARLQDHLVRAATAERSRTG